MNKTLKIVLIVIACIFVLGLHGGIIAFVANGNIANANEYNIGNEIAEMRLPIRFSNDTSLCRADVSFYNSKNSKINALLCILSFGVQIL